MRKLKPSIEQFLDIFNNQTVPALLAAGFKPTPLNAREGLANTTSLCTTSTIEVEKILDDMVKGEDTYSVPIRIFHPKPEEELPVMIYFHGGGGMAGSVTVYDPILRNMAVKTNHIVVAPEYRLAPENPYPQGEIDSRTVYYGILPLLDEIQLPHKKELVIAGDSGGGALSTALIRDVQHDKSMPLVGMVLIYPSVDYTMSFPSYDEDINGKGYLLETEKIKWYFNNYFQKGENRRLASPYFGEISSDIPRTIVFSAEFCPLRDENYAYVEKLREVGVEVEHHNLENMIHTFMNMEDLCKEETDFVYNKIREFLEKK